MHICVWYIDTSLPDMRSNRKNCILFYTTHILSCRDIFSILLLSLSTCFIIYWQQRIHIRFFVRGDTRNYHPTHTNVSAVAYNIRYRLLTAWTSFTGVDLWLPHYENVSTSCSCAYFNPFFEAPLCLSDERTNNTDTLKHYAIFFIFYVKRSTLNTGCAILRSLFSATARLITLN